VRHLRKDLGVSADEGGGLLDDKAEQLELAPQLLLLLLLLPLAPHQLQLCQLSGLRGVVLQLG
jgi:hypothetical protein